jgi:hypothetical protein
MSTLAEMDLPLLMASALKEDGLIGLQLRVAMRADEIAQTGARGMSNDVAHWLQAERDILAGNGARGRD